MHRAVQRFQHCDLIFMDTAGRNYLNELFVAELHSLLNRDEQSETYLVLSLTSKSRDMKKITENFSRYGLDKVIFTKLDETDTCGPLFNLIREYPLELTYLTNGQNVPDDLLTATPDLLVQELLGERTQ
ncbi:Flagellar biosynthesis protein FlhF [compost metagenome]